MVTSQKYQYLESHLVELWKVQSQLTAAFSLVYLRYHWVPYHVTFRSCLKCSYSQHPAKIRYYFFQYVGPMRPVCAALSVHHKWFPQWAISAELCCAAIYKGAVCENNLIAISRCHSCRADKSGRLRNQVIQQYDDQLHLVHL